MLKYAKFMKELVSKRRRMEEVLSVIINDECLAAMPKLPEKMDDLGRLTIPCQFRNLEVTQALTVSGASIKLMPYSFYLKLSLYKQRLIRMAINMENKYVTFPKGMVKELLVKVDNFLIPIDFVVLDMSKDGQVPILLERPVLNNPRDLFDIYEKTITLRVGGEAITFRIDKEMKYSKVCDD